MQKKGYLLKFGKSENIKKLQSGCFYMKNLQYYINIELNSNDGNIGDKFESQFPFDNCKVTIGDIKDKENVLTIEEAKGTINFNYSLFPVFCMFFIDKNNICNKDIRKDRVLTSYSFSEVQKEKMRQFGESVLVIANHKEFFHRIEEGLKKLDDGQLEMDKNFVTYYEKNDAKILKALIEKKHSIVFCKQKKFEFQQEFRICINKEVEDHLMFDIGNLSDIAFIGSSEELLNSYLTVDSYYIS